MRKRPIKRAILKKQNKKAKIKISPKKVLKDINKEKSLNTYQHRFGFYSFECECHPDESPEALQKELQDLHLKS